MKKILTIYSYWNKSKRFDPVLILFVGSVIMNAAPCPGWLWTVMVPLCSSTVFLTMGSPSPVPILALEVSKGLKIVSTFLIPGPVSLTVIVTV